MIVGLFITLQIVKKARALEQFDNSPVLERRGSTIMLGARTNPLPLGEGRVRGEACAVSAKRAKTNLSDELSRRQSDL